MKKVKYILLGLKLFKIVRNWYDLPLILLGVKRTVFLRNGMIFLLNDYMNLLQLIEVIENEEYNFKLRNPKLIMDIGANIGDSSIYFATKFPSAKIVSFEPSVNIYNIFQKNIKINNLSRSIIAKKYAISNKSGKVSFYKYNFSGFSGFNKFRRSGKKTNVNCISLKKAFGFVNGKNYDLVKLDCEGAEFEIILKSDPAIIKKSKNYIIEYHDSLTPYNHKELAEFFKRIKYKVSVRKHPIEDDIGIMTARSV